MKSFFRQIAAAFDPATITASDPARPVRQEVLRPAAQGSRFGPYELIEHIGRGAMGDVYKAIDTRLERTVAVKLLRSAQTERFRREAQAIAALNHPNVCTLYDVGPDYLVMEFIEGVPLRGPFASDEVVRLGLEIVQALESAHEKGIIHRDLKPANILLTRTGIKVLDFGLAKWVEGGRAADCTVSTPGVIVGTPAYMSPEQAQGQPADARSDVFSFGTLLYEMLSGRLPVKGENPISMMMAIVQNDPDTLQAPAPIARIVTRCLRKSPADRFQTMSEVRAALKRTAMGVARDEAIPSIAVLPFANLSADKEDEYFSDGLTEETIIRLAQTPGLRVIARTSAFAFKGAAHDVRTIAESLNVSTVLEGGVRRSGSCIRVTTWLTNADDGSQTWSAHYDREVTDVFAVQDEIAAAIAAALQVQLARKPEERREHVPGVPTYEAYLKGLHHLFKNTPKSLARSEEQLALATKLDPVYAAPHVALAQCYILLGLHGLRPAREIMPLVRAEAKQTLELDPSASLGHAMLGLVAGAFDYDWNEVEQRFRQAMAQRPVPGLVRWPYANFCLAPLGRFREAADQMSLWIEQDPLNVAARADLAFFLNHAGMHDRAVLAARSALELDENYWFAHYAMGEICWALGMRKDALDAAESAYCLAPWNPRVIGLLAGILSQTGAAARARALARELETVGPIGMLVYHLLRSDSEAAAEWYGKAIDQREMFAVLYARSPIMKPLRQSPRWPILGRLINLPEAQL